MAMVADVQPRGAVAWRRISRTDPCPTCGHADGGCLVRDDGLYNVVCLRVESPHPCPWGLGGYYHQCERTATPESGAAGRPLSRSSAVESADADTRHAVYSDLLALCPLSREHRALLTGPGHGLSDAQANRYGTLPSDPKARRWILDRLANDRHWYNVLLSVPGFVLNDRKELEIRAAGIVMTTRDSEGRIVAMDVRRDVVQEGQNRYYKLSSKSDANPDAPGPGAPAHVARPAGGVRDTSTVYVTEGVKKADVVADATGCVALSIPGVANWRAALPVLAALAGDRLVIALDRDDPAKNAGRTVAAVAAAREELAAAAIEMGYAVRIATWDYTLAKGVDDLLIGGHTYTLERYTPAVLPGAAAQLAGLYVKLLARYTALARTVKAQGAALRWKFQRMVAILGDGVMSDGQKLVALALTARLPVPATDGTPAAPTTISAETVARGLGSKVTRQKDGRVRPTRQGTVTKHLADITSLGVVAREGHSQEKVIVYKDKQGERVEKPVQVTTFAYSAVTAPLPGQRLSQDEADATATRARAERLRKRCPRCFGERLQATHYVCADCGETASEREATDAGRAVDEREDGTVVHRESGEVIVPGQRADADLERAPPTSGTRYRNPVSGSAGRGTGASPDRNPITTAVGETRYRNPVTTSTYQGETRYRNPVSGTDPPEVVAAEGNAWRKPCPGGCGTSTWKGWRCVDCGGLEDSS